MNLTKEQGISLLFQLFNGHRLTFRDMNMLKSVFDIAVERVNEEREEMETNYAMGRSAKPTLPSKDVEDDFYYVLENEVTQITSNNTDEIVDLIIKKCEYTIEDLYYF